MAARKIITGPRVVGALVLVVLAATLFFLLRKPALEVEIAEVTRGPLAVTVDDLGETRVKDLYVVAAPVTGQLLRVPLKPGDPVTARSTLIARIQPAEPGPLDARTAAEAEARVRALEAQLAAARTRIAEARAEQSLAEREFGRLAALAPRGFASQAALDRARMTRDRSRALAAETAQSAAAARQSLEAARATLMTATMQGGGRGAVSITSPVSGHVLRVPQESERVVVAGTPLAEIGDPDQLELVTDLLSADAVRVKPGAPVAIEAWGGDRLLRGRVRLVEPFGFTKISALGVEEQRVNVVIDFVDPREAWRRLGHGYRATVRVETWRAPDAVQVPIGALFRSQGQWSVFVVGGDGRAHLRRVVLGPMNEETAAVREGLARGDRVITHPSDRIRDGVKVKTRTSA